MSYKIKVNPRRGHDSSEDTINMGSAKVLSGRIFVLSAFVSYPSSPWRPDEVEDAKMKLYEAERWLQQQARRYGKKVDFHNAGYGSDGSFTDADIPLTFPTPNSYSYPGSIVCIIGFGSRDAFMRWVQRKTGCRQCLVVCFAHQQGRSYAAPATRPLLQAAPAEFTLEGCLIYWRNVDSSCLNPVGIAHEMLHLFGAWDLYRYYGDDDLKLDKDHDDSNRAELAKRMFPRSIMHCPSQNIWDLEIDEVSAWLVGLKPKGKSWYKWFEPYQKEYVAQF